MKSNETASGYKTKSERKYKDSLFCYLFGNESHREYTLALYNAVNGSDYTNPDDISFTTLRDVLYINVKNDMSFLISGKMNFYEHQSTFNPNMPVRMLMYAGKVYNRYIKENELDVYSSAKLPLPVPKCICFYNGTANRHDKSVLKFSDMFESSENPDIEIKVTMYNINHRHNEKLMKACKPLKEYAEFVENVREFGKTQLLETAIENAVYALADDAEIKKLLIENMSEVKTMCITEYTQENADRLREIDINRRIENERKRADDEKKRADEAEKEKNTLQAQVKALQAQIDKMTSEQKNV